MFTIIAMVKNHFNAMALRRSFREARREIDAAIAYHGKSIRFYRNGISITVAKAGDGLVWGTFPGVAVDICEGSILAKREKIHARVTLL